MVSQLEWKKEAEKPSGPGALSAWMANKASFISAGDGSLMRFAFHSGVIQGFSAREIVSPVSSIGFAVNSLA